jgi:hypothetical protein
MSYTKIRCTVSEGVCRGPLPLLGIEPTVRVERHLT